MDGAKDGVIYFSMGSVVQPEAFPPEMIQAIIKTFQVLPQRVIWKWNLDSLPGQPSNVKLGKWLPQQAILGNICVKYNDADSIHIRQMEKSPSYGPI
jgi:glucuronosyltransferase